MDNASKALLMAGGVMIAIAVIGVAVYFYSSARGFARDASTLLSTAEVQSFNRFYNAYKTTSNGGTVRAVDAVNILNRAVEDEIPVKVSGIIKKNANRYDVSSAREYLSNVNFSITSYDDNGRISGISVY